MQLSLPVFAEAAARASVILATTGLAAAALRRSSASARHLVWVLGLTTALVVPALSVAVPKWELPIVRVAPSQGVAGEDTKATARMEAASREDAPAGVTAVAPILRAKANRSTPSSPSPLPPSAPSPATLAIIVWALGAAI